MNQGELYTARDPDKQYFSKTVVDNPFLQLQTARLYVSHEKTQLIAIRSCPMPVDILWTLRITPGEYRLICHPQLLYVENLLILWITSSSHLSLIPTVSTYHKDFL